MIRSVLKRRGFASSSLVRLLGESGARSLRTEATGVTSRVPSWTEENVLSRLGFLRNFSGISHKQKTSSSSSSSDISEPDMEEMIPSHTDTAMLLSSLNAHQFQQRLKEFRGSDRSITYDKLLKLAIDKGAAATEAQSRQLCDAMIASGTIFRYGNRVLLNPAEIADSVRSLLPGTKEETEDLIKELENELEPLEKEKKEIENKTCKASNVVLWSGLFVFAGVALYLWHLTYRALSWDVVEPAAYFITLITGFFYYLYYAWNKRDLEFSSVRTHVHKYVLQRYTTDCFKYETLKNQIATHRAFLKKFKK